MNRFVHRATAVVLLVAAAVATVACAGAPPASTAPSQPLRATSFAEYRVAVCSAWDTLSRVVGNPETGSTSDIGRALEQAATDGDAATADRLAGEMTAELTGARQQLAYASGWEPRAEVVAHLDRLFAAFEATVDATRASAHDGELDRDAVQRAFEEAGGVEAWYGAMDAIHAGGATAADPADQCPNTPVTP